MSAPGPDGKTTRNRLLVALSLISCFALVALAIWRNLPSPRTETPIYWTGPIVNAMAFSRDRGGRYLAAAMSDGRLRIWERESKTELPVKLPSRLSLHDLAWDRDVLVLTGGFEQTVLSWTVKSQQAKKLPTFGVQIVSLACRQNGEILVSLLNGQLVLLNPRTAEKTTIETGHRGIVKSVRFHPSGDFFVTGGADGQLIWHDWKSREIKKKISAHQNEISSLAFSRNGQNLISGSWDQSAKVWSMTSDVPSATLVHSYEVAQVDWMDSDVVTTTWDEKLHVWNDDNASLISEIPWSHGSLAFAVLPSQREVVGIDETGTWHTSKP